ncbi:MAG: PEP-CTERM sorting domain-containing protein, partial [Massilia sp.]
LAFNFNAPGTNYGSVNATVSGGANALDITDLLTASVAANDGWLGLHFQGSDLYQWTYTKDGFGSNRANLQLTVDFADTTDVPEPASLGMLAIGALALAAARRKTRHAA